MIFESGWNQLYTSEITSIWDNVFAHFGNIQSPNKAKKNTTYPKEPTIRKIPLPIPSHPSKEQMEILKKCQEAHMLKGKNTLSSLLSYA